MLSTKTSQKNLLPGQQNPKHVNLQREKFVKVFQPPTIFGRWCMWSLGHGIEGPYNTALIGLGFQLVRE